MPAPALSVKNLVLSHAGRQLVHPLTFAVQQGETVALLGASGSGKSLTASALTGTIPEGITASGEISFGTASRPSDGGSTAGKAGAALISQDPQTSLNPLVPVGNQLTIPLRRGFSRTDAMAEAARLLARVGLEDPAEILRRYTGELSGGQLQRVCVAFALACRTEFLVADEPTTALDAATQQTVLASLRAWVSEGRTLLFITHDLAAAANLCSRALVMENGRIVENAPMAELLQSPQHPYTKSLALAATTTSLLPASAGMAVAA
ncbi:peptide/nickel transport system ATP-binding protein [Pseudarthrobacter sp. W1I19]|uniref:ATP-binding cassette domain-containing protein n=1 Tax=Pseudarthrobacter sp. W1I19 TaxID=3042288 RepID=UPI002787CFFA|nr:ABC transporter ATP-binding protein [Pseudarthrobacter sp. W1I19]MDQ0921714.1 peptide/nickel transport system ATP-binding protein [Pseudarthrobacter sp. W1I19]